MKVRLAGPPLVCFVLSLFAFSLPVGWLQADELTEGLTEPLPNTKPESLNLIDKWESLETLLAELNLESSLLTEDSKKLLKQVQALEIELSELTTSFGELSRLYETSKTSLTLERKTVAKMIKQAEREKSAKYFIASVAVAGWVVATVTSILLYSGQ